MPAKVKITEEEWAVRKAATAARGKERASEKYKAWFAATTPEERHVVYIKQAKRQREYKRAWSARRKAAAEPGRLARKEAHHLAAVERKKQVRKMRYWRLKAESPEYLKAATERSRQKRLVNPEKTRAKKRAYYRKNKKRILLERKRYVAKHREQINLRVRARVKKDPAIRIVEGMRRRLRELLGPQKNRSTRVIQLIGCTRFELHSHLESKFLIGMTWDNYGTAWHVDHVLPCSTFDLSDRDAIHKCFNFTNLQPLWVDINHEKSNRMDYDVSYALAMTPYPS